MAKQLNTMELFGNAQIATKVSQTFETPCWVTLSQRISKNIN